MARLDGRYERLFGVDALIRQQRRQRLCGAVDGGASVGQGSQAQLELRRVALPVAQHPVLLLDQRAQLTQDHVGTQWARLVAQGLGRFTTASANVETSVELAHIPVIHGRRHWLISP